LSVVEKKPVQVYLDRSYLSKLSRLASRLGVSRAEVLRRGLDALARDVIPPEEDPAVQLIGLMGDQSDSPGDLSIEHDRYLIQESCNDQS
jgi:hypothetical protein